MTSAAGRIYLWQGGSLWIGQGTGRTKWHSHHAHQLALTPEGHFRFRTEAEGAWRTFEGAFVPSHCTHQFEVDGVTLAHLFVEPESRAGRALTARFGSGEIAELPADQVLPAVKGLFEALAGNPSRDSMVRAAQVAVAALCGDSTQTDTTLDKRLVRALEYIRANVRNPLSLAHVASAVSLSESHFRHLFVAGTGSSFRAYLLWLRINPCHRGGHGWCFMDRRGPRSRIRRLGPFDADTPADVWHRAYGNTPAGFLVVQLTLRLSRFAARGFVRGLCGAVSRSRSVVAVFVEEAARRQ